MKGEKIKMRKTKTQRGITLIALIITIVVLLILAAVAISSIQNDGILHYAQNAADSWNKASQNEAGILGDYVNYLANMGATGENVETISTDEDCVGYYVNLDNNKTDAEGIIYIDLAKTTSGSWNDYSYTITNVTNGLKEYTVIEEEYTTEEFGTAKLIEAVAGSTGTTERFYVMALTDVNPGTYYCWYDAAFDSGISDSSVAATGIGAGKTNTSTMLTKWNADEYGAKNDNGTYEDMWGIVEDGWYIPSADEWAAFGSTLNITSSDYRNKGLESCYWSSSRAAENSAYYVNFNREELGEYGLMGPDPMDFSIAVRLGTTF